MQRVIFYSCLYGDTEPLNPQLFEAVAGTSAFLFTDQKDLKPNGAEVIHPLDSALPPDMASRRAKLMPERYLPSSEWVIYCDNRCKLLISPNELIDKIEAIYGPDAPEGRYFFPHPWCDCVYEEAIAVTIQQPLTLSDLDLMVDTLRQAGILRHSGLTQNTMLIQKMGCAETEALNQLWFEVFLAYIHRDQISLRLAAAALQHKVRVLPFMMSEIAKWPTISRSGRLAYQGRKQSKPSVLFKWRLKQRQRAIERTIPSSSLDA